MDVIAGMNPTGRRLRGPASDLVELDGANGLRHTAIVFQSRYAEHNAINDALSVVRAYLGSPMVTGMLELADVDDECGAYVYPTGHCWSVAEVIRVLADKGEVGGTRAGLELMFACGQILVEAADTGEAEGVYSHGGLTPWRVMLRADGQVLVIGYALPQVEILEFHANAEQVPREDSFRYCPPERMEASTEDITSDLFGLTLIAFELITGKPVYDGLVDDIRQQAARGEGSRRLFRFRDDLSPKVRELLVRALKPSADHRYPSGDDFLDAVRAVLRSSDVTGPSLVDLMAKVSRHAQRGGSRPEAASTMMGSADDFRKLIDPEPEDDGVWSPAPHRPGRRAAPRTLDPGTVEDDAPAEEAPAQADEMPALEDARAAEPTGAERRPVRRVARRKSGGDQDLMASLRRTRERDGETSLESESSVASSRVSAVTRGRRGAAPTVPADENATDSADERSAQGGSDDLLRRIRSSRDSDTEPVEGDDATNASPRRTTRSGGSFMGGLPVTTGPTLTPAADDDEFMADDASGDTDAAVDEPNTWSLDELVDPPPVGDETSSGAAASEVDASPETAPSEPMEEADAPVEAMVEAPRVVQVASPPPEAARVEQDGSFVAAADLGRPPDPLPAGTRGARTQRLALVWTDDSDPIRLKVAGAQPLGEVVANLVGSVLPTRLDLVGRLTGWYRLEHEGVALPVEMNARDVPAERLTIRFVANTMMHADISVVSETQNARFVAPVGTAVPVTSLVDHLCCWMGLPAGEWRLSCGDRALAGYETIGDLGFGPAQVVPLRLWQSAE